MDTGRCWGHIRTLGAVVAALIADEFSWRMSYFVGGGLGLLLLLLVVPQSGMFNELPRKIKKSF